MLDNREPIPEGETLEFEGICYHVSGEIGRGGSCLVYRAYYEEAGGLKHEVRIKECYPYNMGIKRDFRGTLSAFGSFQPEFEDAKVKFCEAYERNVEIRNTLGLTNSTVNPVFKYFQNNTWYSVTSYIEGTDYERLTKDDSLQDVFGRMGTLSKIIQKYHQKGILHLDIKPENILIIPETKDHMVLFDFDSMIPKGQLGKQAVRISYSDGFSAPELVQGKQDRICEATDIFSIGAVVFYKLFHRKPTVFDREAGAEFDYDNMEYTDKRYQPELYKKLNVFFHKTLSSCIANRYHQIEEVMEALKELEEIADVNKRYLRNNFSYDMANFVGRKREMDDIGQAFADNHVVFVSGIGGIGKTEVAKRYAYVNREKFRRIVFVSFINSIVETVCGSDIRINGLERGQEKEEDFFERKIEILKDVVEEDDLIILDNFDVGSEDNLEKLFECPCEFLVTSREDFQDYNYKQIMIDKMECMDDVISLFEIYNPVKYDGDERSCVEHIIRLVACHTMAVELIAKYLKNTEELPSVLLDKLMEKEGITSIDDVEVKHRKDKKLKSESVDNHLQILFDLSKFSSEEQELIRSLSLFGYVRILKEQFLSYCEIENNDRKLENLIKRGWIEFDRKSGKISLHQIILDLVYNHMHPIAENCPHIVWGMRGYAESACANNTEREVKQKLLGYFIERTKGQSIEYASLLVAYCKKLHGNPRYVDCAAEICKNHKGETALELMQQICILRIWEIAEYKDLSGTELELDDYYNEKFGQIHILANQAYGYARKCFCNQESFGRFCLELAYIIDNAVNYPSIFFEKNCNDLTLKQLYEYADYLLAEAEKCFIESGMTSYEKEKLFERIQEFYAEDDFCAYYRREREENYEKALHIQTILNKLRDDFEEEGFCYIYSSDISYYDQGKKAEKEGKFEKAIQLYLKSLEEEEEDYCWIYSAISDVYKKKGNLNKAKEYLEKILEMDKEDDEYTSYICIKLVKLLISQNKDAEAVGYLKELVLYNMTEGKDEDNIARSFFLFGHYWLYRLEKDPELKKDYWRACLKSYERVEINTEVIEEVIDFIMEYISLMEEGRRQIDYVFSVAEKLFISQYRKSEYAVKLLSFIINKYEGSEEYVEDYIRALMMTVENLGIWSEQLEDVKTALDYCRRADSAYVENECNNAYLKNFIIKNWGDCYFSNDDPMADSLKRQCDYYLFAQGHVNGKSLERKMEIWKTAADEYVHLKNWELAEKCYKQVFDLYDTASCQYEDFREYWKTFIDRIKGLIKQKNQLQFNILSEKLLKELIHFEFDVDTQEDLEHRANDFSEMLQKMADYFVKMDSNAEAFNLYILSIIAAVGRLHDKAFFQDACADLRLAGETIQKELARVLQWDITEKMVDIVMDVNEQIQQLNLQGNLTMEYQKIIREFSNLYKYRDVEFKRQ